MSDKKNKHITINLSVADFEKLKQEAENDNRTVAGYTALIIKKYLDNKTGV